MSSGSVTPKGIIQAANNCYLNSGLQLLYTCTEFVNLIKGIDSTTTATYPLLTGNNLIVFNVIKKFFEDYYNSVKIFNATSNIAQFNRKLLKLNNTGQEDSGEFLIKLLQKLPEIFKGTALENSFYDLLYFKEQSILLQKEPFKIDNSNAVDCNLLNIPIDPIYIKKDIINSDLNGLINDYLSNEYIDIKERLSAKPNFDYKRLCLLQNLPMYAIIFLMRTSINKVTKTSTKIEQPLLKENNEIYIPFHNQTIDAKNQLKNFESSILFQKYDINGFICHNGSTGSNGHYISYCLRNNIWYKINADVVDKIESTNSAFIDDFKRAYVFLYKKDAAYAPVTPGSGILSKILGFPMPPLPGSAITKNGIPIITKLEQDILDAASNNDAKKRVNGYIDTFFKTKTLQSIYLLKYIIFKIINQQTITTNYISILKFIFTSLKYCKNQSTTTPKLLDARFNSLILEFCMDTYSRKNGFGKRSLVDLLQNYNKAKFSGLEKRSIHSILLQNLLRPLVKGATWTGKKIGAI
jgi:hypothetical protein